MTNRTNAKFLQVLLREAREDPSRLSRSHETRPRTFQGQGSAAKPQRPCWRPQSVVAYIIFWGSEGVQGGVGVLRASKSPLRSNGKSLTLF